MIKKLFKFSFIFLLILLISCKKNKELLIDNNNPMKNIKTIKQAQWNKLANKNIYFGHQSVGYNMIDGIESILKENPNIKIDIKEGNELIKFESPVFAHAKIGKNGNPKSKIDAFYKIIDESLGENVDIAGFKFCYVDFNKNTDVKDVFENYKLNMDKINQKYPNTKIIHFTAPIRAIQTGPKAWVKKLLNKSIGIEDNHTRQQFNELLNNEYKDQSVFDIAKFESTYPDKSREFTKVNGEKIYSMIPDYTNDGGHLSKNGKYHIGTQFLLFLVDTPKGKVKHN